MRTTLGANHEPLMQEMLEFRLAQRDDKPVNASHGREALARLEDSAPDDVVLDG